MLALRVSGCIVWNGGRGRCSSVAEVEPPLLERERERESAEAGVGVGPRWLSGRHTSEPHTLPITLRTLVTQAFVKYNLIT